MIQETGAPALSIVLDDWPAEQASLKKAFLRLKAHAEAQGGANWSLVSRPGVSYSLRFDLNPRPEGRARQVFFLTDVVVAGEMFLSVCFYEDEISDPHELGNAIPQGLFKETGYCFDVDNDNCGEEMLLNYLEDRIEEAHAKATAKARG
jgi:hypothetical protein